MIDLNCLISCRKFKEKMSDFTIMNEYKTSKNMYLLWYLYIFVADIMISVIV